MYVHIIHDQCDDIINKQQCIQKTGNCCVKVKVSHIGGDCDLASILGNVWALQLLQAELHLL